MKRTLLAAALSTACALAVSAPLVVTPGSNAGYLYFPKGSSGTGVSDKNPNGTAGVTIDGMQLARTACYTNSGTVVLPTGFTSGYIQAILVGGGQGTGLAGMQPPGQATSITHADIGTITAQGGSNSVAGSRGGSNGEFVDSNGLILGGLGGGGGGYLGRGGNASSAGDYPAPGGQGGGTRGGGGQGFGYGESEGGKGAPGAAGPNSQPSPAPIINGSVGLQPDAPAVILCPNVPTASGYFGAQGGTGFGAGGGGGGNSGQIASVVFKYTSGPITVIVGAGGGGGAPGVVALRFIPQ